MRMVITIEGGLIQRITTDDPEIAEDLEILVADYDTDGANPMDLFIDPRDPEAQSDFRRTSHTADLNDKEVDAIFDAKTVFETYPHEDDRDVDGVQERIGLQDNNGRIIGGDL